MLGVTIYVLTAVLALATAISYLRIPHGFVRIFSFPRLQFLTIAALLFVLQLWRREDGLANALTMIALVAVIVAHALAIVQFTPLRRKQTASYDGDPDGPNTISILSFNVKESNTDHARAIALADACDADIALYMETNRRWVDALTAGLAGRYPHNVAVPLENAYGMVMFSRFPLANVQMRELVMEEVPSITADVTLPDGHDLRLFCVHPEPPVPHIDSLGRDAELLKVAELVRDGDLPAVVTGDLNDVAWSNTTRMFQRLSRLLDPRVGRGFYNTFDSRFPLLRWPLDHLFHDRRFSLIEMKRLPNSGSDHFPMYFKLALNGHAAEVEMPDEADADDRQEAREIKQESRELDRDPIGADWEK